MIHFPVEIDTWLHYCQELVEIEISFHINIYLTLWGQCHEILDKNIKHLGS